VCWLILAVLFGAGPSAPASGEGSVIDILRGLDGPYLAFLGGPYAAALLAKVATETRSTGDKADIQKTTAPEGSAELGQLVESDDGEVSLADTQYLMLNLAVATYVVYSYLAHQDSIPAVPAELAVLTGGSALTYLSNKGLASDAPSITAIFPKKARVGEHITIRGANLVAPGQQIVVSGATTPTDKATKVEIGGVMATVEHATASELDVVVPANPGLVAGQEHEVRVITGATLVAPTSDRLTVIQ